MAQDVKAFVCGRDIWHATYNTTPLDEQINEFLKEHPNYSAKSMSTFVGTGYKEVFVIFDVREEKQTNTKNKGGRDNG